MIIPRSDSRIDRRRSAVERLSRRDVIRQWRTDIVPYASMIGADLDTSWIEYVSGLIRAGAVGRSAYDWPTPRVCVERA